MISDYVESLTRNWNLDFWILIFFFWETDRPRAVTVSCEVNWKKQWRKNCRLWGWGAPKVLFVTTLNHSALHWTVRNLRTCDNSVIKKKTTTTTYLRNQGKLASKRQADLDWIIKTQDLLVTCDSCSEKNQSLSAGTQEDKINPISFIMCWSLATHGCWRSWESRQHGAFRDS